MSRKLAIIGAGGHGKVVGEIALLNNYNDVHFFDNKADKIKEYPFSIAGNLNHLEKNINDFDYFFVAIGDNRKRYDNFQWLKKYKVEIINLIHPKSTISKFSFLEKGICVMANAVINSGSKIKEGAIINTSATIDHDCMIDDFVHISPNCSLSGGVTIGKYSHIGTGTSIHPGKQIGKDVKTAVGSKVFKDIIDGSVYKI